MGSDAPKEFGQPTRYAVIVWMHDHWGSTFETNDRIEAIDAFIRVSKKVTAICIDTEAGDVV